MPRWLGMLLILPVGTGCLIYAYPTISQTPELVVENPDGAARAFRVDIDTITTDQYRRSEGYTLSTIPIDSQGLIPSQLEIGPTTAAIYPLTTALGMHEYGIWQYTMLVHVYRPGYQTIEVKDRQKTRELQWVAAPDLPAQEKAIEDLLADPYPRCNVGRAWLNRWWEQEDRIWTPLGIRPGSFSLSQRKALEFAASEYQRLADSPAASAPDMQQVRYELQKKAIWYRAYAAQKAE